MRQKPHAESCATSTFSEHVHGPVLKEADRGTLTRSLSDVLEREPGVPISRQTHTYCIGRTRREWLTWLVIIAVAQTTGGLEAQVSIKPMTRRWRTLVGAMAEIASPLAR